VYVDAENEDTCITRHIVISPKQNGILTDSSRILLVSPMAASYMQAPTHFLFAQKCEGFLLLNDLFLVDFSFVPEDSIIQVNCSR